MKRVLASLAFLWITGAAFADGDGADVIPFSSVGGVVTGTITVYPDGTAILAGQIQGAQFAGSGPAARNPDGSWDFPGILYSDLVRKQKSWIPLQLHFIGKEVDSQDGDDMDDPAGAIEVQSQSGVGMGSIQLGC